MLTVATVFSSLLPSLPLSLLLHSVSKAESISDLHQFTQDLSSAPRGEKLSLYSLKDIAEHYKMDYQGITDNLKKAGE